MINKNLISFYCDALALLQSNQCEFMVGGGYAVVHYTDVHRATKDLDIFCQPHEYPKILKCFADNGYSTELTDSRWLAKVFKDDHFIDIIFDTVNNICKVDDTWYAYAEEGNFYGVPVRFIPPEELIWCKIYVQNRERNDSADVNHLLLRTGHRLDWTRLWKRLDTHWHLLLAQLLIFQFVYPSDYRSIIPDWLFHDLLTRAREQYDLPSSLEKVCRGPLIDQTQYEVDIKEWNYKAYTIKTV
ncbi:nucleotidyltransferase [Parapedobacter deserti]|uniref:Nucleotidyltransferase n=1 Tax=Parapedobacter deserti TaxID=1912957 RepID=A0ABV7JPJ6_9SPHI